MTNFAEYAPKSLAAGAPPRTPLGELKRSPKSPSRNARGFAPRARALRALEPRALSAPEQWTVPPQNEILDPPLIEI